jgi:hypothetical protein
VTDSVVTVQKWRGGGGKGGGRGEEEEKEEEENKKKNKKKKNKKRKMRTESQCGVLTEEKLDEIGSRLKHFLPRSAYKNGEGAGGRVCPHVSSLN